MIIAGDAIARYRLCALRSALKLEQKGLKHSGGAIRPRIAAELGLKPRDSHDKFIAKLEEMINDASI